jgi:cytochrome c553
MNNRLLLTIAALLTALCGSARAAETATLAPQLTPDQTQFFEGKIRPLLTANCYKCHSAEQGKAKGGLTLDTREGLLKGGENGPILIPGDPAKSKLITAVTYNDPDLQMPPKGEKLSEKEIADLTAWIKMGAPDPRVTSAGGPKLTGLNDKARAHWAYQPVKNPEVPAVQNKPWPRTPIDNFILAKLEESAMKPSPQASKETLLRRATFDLIGLAPTPEELRAFIQDQSPSAFEKVVDRLLASPHYGERWGRYWLDSARYSDTSGNEKNNAKEDYRYAYAWTYRDWVINAFNKDLPYDQFIKLQIAADQMIADKSSGNTNAEPKTGTGTISSPAPSSILHPPSSSSPSSLNPEPQTLNPSSNLAALGFLTVGKRFPNPNDTIDERIDALGKSTMALTVACARCHDHKFDPIPTADYYSLHGIFASTVEPADKPMIGQAPTGPEYQDFQQKLAQLEQKNRDIYCNYVETKSAEFRAKAGTYLLTSLYYRKNNTEAIKKRNELIASSKLDRDLYQNLRIVRPDSAVFFPLMRFSLFQDDKFAEQAKKLLDQIATGKIGPRSINPLVVAAFKDVEPDSLNSIQDVVEIYGKLFTSIDVKAKEYQRACRTATAPRIEGFDPDLVELIDTPAEAIPSPLLDSERLKQAAGQLPQQNNNAYQRFLFADINELQLTHPGAPARAMVVTDGQSRNSPIFIRGEAQNRGPIVPHRFLEILAGPNRQPFKGGSGRLDLANAIASKDNPLTARVMINRIWMHHFGEGFVRTADDMGVQSEPPSHPELIDYLATRFMNEGWSIKKVHKLIMMSAAYQQSSDTNPAFAQKDPGNRLLWRANLRRLDFEAVRDTMLQFTGKLDPTIGGKPVNLTDEPYSNRRSVYGYIDRGNVPELMQQFDFADPDMANSKRTTTIVPQQALFFMNSPMSVDVARKVTSRPEFLATTDDASRVRAIYQVLFQRPPRPEEIRFAADFYNAKVTASPQLASARTTPADKQLQRKLNKPQPKVLGKRGGKQTIQNEGDFVERRPLTVWEEYAQALLFTNEIAYVN